MAITGTGTELDPYIVHNYDELKTAIEYENYDSTTSTYGTNYVKLANDINCNDYGSAWTWSPIEIASSTAGKRHKGELDLDGHTIKNVLIATGNTNYMFQGFQEGNVAQGVVKNGKLLNIFMNASRDVFAFIKFDNVSCSMDYANPTNSSPIRACQLYNSSFYIQSSNAGGSNKSIFSSSPTAIDNCDIEIHINNCTNGTGTFIQYRGTNESSSLSNSRLRGDITGTVAITSANSKLITNVTPTNCVFELDINGFTLGSNISSTAILGNSPTCVINESKILPWMTVGTTLKAPNDQAMRSASALNALGFPVVQVSE